MRRTILPCLLLAGACLAGSLFFMERADESDSYPPLPDRPGGGPEQMQYHLSRVNWPYGPSLPEAKLVSLIDAEELRPNEDQYNPQKAPTPWQVVGPFGLPVRGEAERFSGRLRAIRRLPGGQLRVASASGGIFQEVGLGWVPIADLLEVSNIGSFDHSPTTGDTILVGTGDPYGRGGLGIYRSLDGGSSWTNAAGPGRGNRFHDLQFAPPSWGTNDVYAAGDKGVMHSQNSGASWAMSKRGYATSISFDPSKPGTIYAGFQKHRRFTDYPADYPAGGLFKSTNNGLSWDRIEHAALPDTNDINQVTVEVCRNQPKHVWAIFSSFVIDDGKTKQKVNRLARSRNEGVTWEDVSLPGGIDDNFQGWYNQLLAVHPDNPDRIFVGGTKLYYSSNGSSFGGERDVHADQHVALWTGANEIYVGNDGGLYHSTDSGQNWSTLKNSLPITQFEDIAICRHNPDMIAGGAQDNGLSVTFDRVNWEVFHTGDGGGVAMAAYDCSDAIMATGAFGSLSTFRRRKTEDGFGSISDFEGGIPSNDTWYPSMRWPRVGSLVYTFAEFTVYSAPALSGPWTAMRTFSDKVHDLQVDEMGRSVWVTLNEASIGDRVWVFVDGVWTARDSGLPDNRILERVKPDPTSGHHGRAYLIASNGTLVTGHIFYTDDFGATWLDIGGTQLGDVIPTDVLQHPSDPNQIYVSHTRGMVWTPNRGTNWFDADTGAPASLEISDLYAIANPYGATGDFWLYAGTYGRGVWRRSITTDTVGPPDVANTTVRALRGAITTTTLLAHPDGSGATLGSQLLSIAVQVLDSNLVPVAGIDPSRITLSANASSSIVVCDPLVADAPTDASGWTTISGSPSWGGWTGQVRVYIDGMPVPNSATAPSLPLEVVSTDIDKDLRVDLGDLRRFALDDGLGFVPRSDLDGDGNLDEDDATILAEAILAPRSCPFTPPALEADDGELGVYFDLAATQFGQIVDVGDTFTVHVVAKDIASQISAVEFAIPGLEHPSVEVIEVNWTHGLAAPMVGGGGEFRAVLGYAPFGPQVHLASITARLVGTAGGVRLCPEPLAAPSFGTPTILGVPGHIDETGAKHRFKLMACAEINPFPLAVYLGLEHQALGSASLLPQGSSLIIGGLGGPTSSGAAAYFDRARPPGSKREATKLWQFGVDGYGYRFTNSLPAANLPDGAQFELVAEDQNRAPLVQLTADATAGQWSVQVDMSGVGSPTLQMEALLNGNLVAQDAAFGGNWLASDALAAEATVLVRTPDGFRLLQFWNSPIDVVIGGNPMQIDELSLATQAGNTAADLSIGRAVLQGRLIPDVGIDVLGIQRFGEIFTLPENLALSSERYALRLLLQDPTQPGRIQYETLLDQPVDVSTLPPQSFEANAEVTLGFLNRPLGNEGRIDLVLKNGPTYALTADPAGMGALGWTLRGHLGGQLVLDVGVNGADLGTVDRWPSRSLMSQTALEVQWSAPAALEVGNGKQAVSVDRLELVPVQPQLALPNGASGEISFVSMSELALVDAAAATAIEPAPVAMGTRLHAAVPNPFNPSTEIRFTLAVRAAVRLEVYDARGRRVRTLSDKMEDAGEHLVRWDGRDDAGSTLASGVYHAVLDAGGERSSTKLVLLK